MSPECAEACGYVLSLVLYIWKTLSLSFHFLESCVSLTNDLLVSHVESEQPKFSAECTVHSSNWPISICRVLSQSWKYVHRITESFVCHLMSGTSQGRDVDLLFGLDMLKTHQACIDLQKGVLRIQGREVQFLPEHELPDKARFPEVPPGSEPFTNTAGSRIPDHLPSGGGFPGTGQTLGSVPRASLATQPASSNPPSHFPESSIQMLMGLGVSRDDAIRALGAAGGNVDIAASLLF